jgi:hypothetical protein
MKTHDTEAARRLYQPSIAAIANSYRLMGESLQKVCRTLADEMTLEATDNAIAAIGSAHASLRRLRLRLVSDKVNSE